MRSLHFAILFVSIFACSTVVAQPFQGQVHSGYTGPTSVPPGQPVTMTLNYSWSNATGGGHTLLASAQFPSSVEFVSGDASVTPHVDPSTQKLTVTSQKVFSINVINHPSVYSTPSNPFAKPQLVTAAYTELQGPTSGNGSTTFSVRFKTGTPNATQACPAVTIADGNAIVNTENSSPCLTCALTMSYDVQLTMSTITNGYMIALINHGSPITGPATIAIQDNLPAGLVTAAGSNGGPGWTQNPGAGTAGPATINLTYTVPGGTTIPSGGQISAYNLQVAAPVLGQNCANATLLINNSQVTDSNTANNSACQPAIKF
jgi:hypothetical protein